MSYLLTIDSVTKTFGGLIAVRDLSLGLGKGEIVGLIGPNGAGKTTAFNLITGAYKPDSGRILFEEKLIVGQKPHKISQLGVARTFQTVRPLGRMTVIENVMMGRLFGREKTRSMKQAKESALEIIEYTSLSGRAFDPAADLSLAEQRRLELARALATRPKLLLLDEVMAGLNPSEISSTLDLLRRLNSEKQISILVIEHVVKAVMKLCSKIIVMDHGSKIAEGSPDQISTNVEVIRAYMGEKRAGKKSNVLPQSGSQTTTQDLAESEKQV
ncbi:MAG TPA: ABC transporter ATP-binding protein [Nitrososphaerales archaeon]|nr:ABC transporter ATP-binding protein [Nitrososphaerales archaeon]